MRACRCEIEGPTGWFHLDAAGTERVGMEVARGGGRQVGPDCHVSRGDKKDDRVCCSNEQVRTRETGIEG